MSYTNGLDKPSDYFNTITYSGNGSNPRTLTGVGFQPDWVWQKNRTDSNGHTLADAIRGANKTLSSDGSGAEVTDKNDGHLDAFTSDGFTVGAGSSSDARVNDGSHTYVAWNWLGANGTASNSNGSITSSVSANTTAGFSIVSYTGTGSSTTVGHGLGVAPSMLIFKNRDSTDSWNVQHDGLTSYDYYVRLNSSGAQNNDIDVGNSAPTSTVVSVGSHAQQNGNGNDMILYAFAEKKGYSKFGSYTGNSNADGTFVYTGFKPAFVITKASSVGQSWQLYDNKRNTFNQSSKILFPNLSASEQDNSSAAVIDILSNGFKQRVNDAGGNGSGETYIYMAFAEQPFVTSTGIPTTAR